MGYQTKVTTQLEVNSRRHHHFTVDVEEYYQVSALEPYVDRAKWDQIPSRVEHSTRRILDLLDSHRARGTFFVLSWVATRHPQLVREITERGHEVASHGSDHRRVTHINPDQFRTSVRESKEVLENVTGQKILGYRAPSFSIVPGREWALDILVEEGYVYDSSLYPIRRPGYGYASTPRHPHVMERAAGRLLEFPPATLQVFRLNLPAGGGAYLRLLPANLVNAAVMQAERQGEPATLYIHPWEIDADQPRIPVPPLTRIRHYGRLATTYGRLEDLLHRFPFRTIADTIATA